MNIIFIKDYSNELGIVFKEYDIASKMVFETRNLEQLKYIKKYSELKEKIDNWVIDKIKDNEKLIFNEEEYEVMISNPILSDLLSNGLYTSEDIEVIIEQYGDSINENLVNKIRSFFKEYNNKILIWNMYEVK